MGTIHLLTQHELSRLFAAIQTKSTKGKRDKAIFLVAYHHGLRASEVGLLRRVDFDQKALRITIRRLKDGNSGVYPFDPSSTKAVRSSGSQTWLTNPMRCAVSASIALPVSRNCLACSRPRRYTQSMVVGVPKMRLGA